MLCLIHINGLAPKDSGRLYFMQQCGHKSADSQYCRLSLKANWDKGLKGTNDTVSRSLHQYTAEETGQRQETDPGRGR